jgi:hypothetical protein
MRGFPKRVVLPMVLFVTWVSLFAALPLPVFLGLQNTILFLSIVQPCFGIALLVILRYFDGNREWLYSRSAFEQPIFRWKRLVGFVAANVIVVVPLLGVFLAFSLSVAISHLSQGFLHLGLTGISVEARTYLYEGKTIDLLPTSHIAQSSFYKELVEPLSEERTVVIPEGVTDKNKLLKKPLDYRKLARSLGLEAQTSPRSQTGQIGRTSQPMTTDRHTRSCDVDMSEFSPIHPRLYRHIGTLVIRRSSHGSATVSFRSRPGL